MASLPAFEVRRTVDGRQCAALPVPNRRVIAVCTLAPDPSGTEGHEWCYVEFGENSAMTGAPTWGYCAQRKPRDGANMQDLGWYLNVLRMLDAPQALWRGLWSWPRTFAGAAIVSACIMMRALMLMGMWQPEADASGAEDARRLCVACQDRESSFVLETCGHLVYCTECGHDAVHRQLQRRSPAANCHAHANSLQNTKVDCPLCRSNGKLVRWQQFQGRIYSA
mmetsp:Transcript_136847/g.381461  ORF Transcript_136847/g.381461 Transcript_136847/m.381461 type:complete len:223 (+) Transcript_136847:60-728(+)